MPWVKKRQVYQLYIVLLGIEPEIWRRFQVSSHITLRRLHNIIQVVMGWENCHMHQFLIDDSYYGIPWEDESLRKAPGFYEIEDEKQVQLWQVINEKEERFSYEYDFGDSWEHGLELEKILPPEATQKPPVCLEGERACPPEDCGGPFGYSRILQYFEDPNSVDLEEARRQAIEEFDPAEFDLESVNEKLKAFRR